MRIHFIRHGESVANVERVLSTRGWKHPLTPRGRAQARAVAERFEAGKVSGLWTSPLQRAVETAEIIGHRLNLKPQIERELAEFNVGDEEDRVDDGAWARLREIERRWDAGDLEARLRGGESCAELRARFSGVIGRAVAEHAGLEVTLVMISHGGVLERALPELCTNLTAEEARRRSLPNCGVVEVLWVNGVARCMRWTDEGLP